MYDSFIDTLEFFPRGLVYVALGIVVLVVAKLVLDLVTPYKINRQLAEKNNSALGLSITGYFMGVIIVFAGVLYQPLNIVRDDQWQWTGDFWLDVLEVAIYSLVGIVLLNASRLLVDRLVLYKFNTEKEIIEDQNSGSAAVEAGVYVAAGLVIAASIAGSTGGIEGVSEVSIAESALRSLAFFGMGMAVLVLFSLFYELTTSFNIHDEIEKNNVAVGVALGGNLVAIGLVTFKAVFGEFIGWGESIASFLTFAVIGFALLYVVRTAVDFALLPGTRISHELAVDRNVGVAFIESGVVIGASIILYFAI
ncbi:MAG: DUF350 domain-containing protein [SAR202 cluster bacterium]|jgi:uncharacterized membrane protein YjfL (UPF0719 family)|nr:DUF350 domain-containing protein [SAR202 cluster bacterium]